MNVLTSKPKVQHLITNNWLDSCLKVNLMENNGVTFKRCSSTLGEPLMGPTIHRDPNKCCWQPKAESSPFHPSSILLLDSLTNDEAELNMATFLESVWRPMNEEQFVTELENESPSTIETETQLEDSLFSNRDVENQGHRKFVVLSISI